MYHHAGEDTVKIYTLRSYGFSLPTYPSKSGRPRSASFPSLSLPLALARSHDIRPAIMPASASSNFPADLIGRLSSVDGGAKIKALREVKNQIIGNPTKKVYYIKLGLVPSVVSVLSTASDSDSELLIQAAAVLGSFSCGVEAGVEAVLSAGALPHLLRLLSSPDEKASLITSF